MYYRLFFLAITIAITTVQIAAMNQQDNNQMNNPTSFYISLNGRTIISINKQQILDGVTTLIDTFDTLVDNAGQDIISLTDKQNKRFCEILTGSTMTITGLYIFLTKDKNLLKIPILLDMPMLWFGTILFLLLTPQSRQLMIHIAKAIPE